MDSALFAPPPPPPWGGRGRGGAFAGWFKFFGVYRPEKIEPSAHSMMPISKNLGNSRVFRSFSDRNSEPSGAAASSRCLFLEPFAHSEPKKSNPASQGTDDVQKTRTLRAPDLSKMHLGAGGEKINFLTWKSFLEIDFFKPGNFPIFRLVSAPARNFEPSGAQAENRSKN